MTKFIGRLLTLGIARETTRGTPVDPAYIVPHVSFSFDDKVIKARSDGALNSLADSEESFVTTKYGQGELEGEVRDESFGLFLYAMLGSLSTSGPTDSAYTHSFTLSESNTHTSLTFTVSDENTTEQYRLCMLDQLEIISELDEVVKFTASFMGKTGKGRAWSVGNPDIESKFTKKHLTFKVAADTDSLAAASAISLKSLRLTISKNVILDDVLGTAEPEDILNRQISIEGEIALNYTDETWKNYMRENTYRAMLIEFTNTDDVIEAGSTRPKLTMQFPKVDFFDWEPDYALNEIVTQRMSFKCSRNMIAEPQAIISTCQLVNGVSSY